MKGKVALLNPTRGMASLITETGEHTSFEVLGPFNLNLNDIINGDLESLGSETWYNVTKMEQLDVFVEDIHCSSDRALKIIT